VSEVTVYTWINKAIDECRLVKFDRGIYYLPRDGVLGKVPLSPQSVINKKYLTDGRTIYGYISGLNLENEAGVSQQVPATLSVTTNNTSMRVREIKPFGGWRKIWLRQPQVEITGENVDALRLLDLITNTQINTLGRSELKALKVLASQVGRSKALEYSRYYPAKTAKKLIESETCGVFADNSAVAV
jgi:hypothetical protein